ncbi:MAG: type II toxin-antitoxin system MqsA family antitoxin [bacterium]
MKCVFCKQSETQPGKVTVTLQRGETTVIIKGVPADVCKNCGEYYLSEDITGQVLARAEEAVKKGTEVEILRFAA